MTLTIHLQPETGRGLLAKAQAKGIAPADFVEEIVAREVKSESAPAGLEAKNLVELFEASPFKGLGLAFERDQDYGRIAATALEHSLTVVTRNVKDFDSLGVPVLNPWESA